MNIEEAKRDAAVRSKKGISFILAGTVIWLIIAVVFSLTNLPIETKNIAMLVATGIMFPIAVGLSTLLKVEWKQDDNPLNMLGLIINLAQFMYFPLVFWAFAHSPEQMVLFFAIITAAHFFPYGWFYESKAYYVMAPVASVLVAVVGWNLEVGQLWIIPLVMIVALFTLALWIFVEKKQLSMKKA